MATTPILALDVGDSDSALRIVSELGDSCRFYKIGSELYTAAGPAVVESVMDRGASVFLDLKFHDIPNTVRGAVRSAASLGASLLTVHVTGGRAMLEGALGGVQDVAGKCEVFGVTALTSLDSPALSDIFGRTVDVGTEVLRLAGLARDAGLHGVVCSGREAGVIRDEFEGRLATLVPGIRLPGSDTGDQARVVTPGDAAAAGARYIVVGRTVTAARSPRRAMEEVLAGLS